MALFLKQNEDRSPVQTKVATELQERLKKKADIDPYAVPENAVTQGQHTTRGAGLLIAALLLVLAGAIVWAVNQ